MITGMNDNYTHEQPSDNIVTVNSLKKRKSEEDAVASALLSLDGRNPPKRYRSTTPPIESREMPNISSHQSPEQRESEETSLREESSTSFSSKLSRRFMARFEGDNPSRKTFLESGETADSNDLASAMALTSLAHHSPPQDIPSSNTKYQKRPMNCDGYRAHVQRQSPHATQMANIAMPSFQGPSIYRDYYNNMPYNYGPSSMYTYHNQAPQQWACDFCNRASFSTFDEACNHEKVCNCNPEVQHKASPAVPHPEPSSRSISMTCVGSTESKRSILANNKKTVSSPADEDESKFFCGTIPLAVPAADLESLSEMNCYIRKECIQAFSADTYDVLKSSKRGRIAQKQIGIKCAFCADVDIESRAMSAVSYPVSSSGIYESVKRWIKIHLPLCNSIPVEVKNKIAELEMDTRIQTRRQYWIDSAKALGINDTRSGLRFTHDVSDEGNALKAATTLFLKSNLCADSNSGKGQDKEIANPTKGKFIVSTDDEAIITPFLYALLRQVEPCQFTDADKYIARSRCSTGFNGFQCRHCSGHAGLGKYFPTSQRALATNSTSQNIFSHVLKCRKCPDEVKEQLKTLKHEKGHWTRRTTGWRQKFFEEVWKRLHEDRGELPADIQG